MVHFTLFNYSQYFVNYFSPPKANLIISGAQTKGHADFPPEAVQHYHDKPLPTHDNNRPANTSRSIVIQQPRK